MPNSFIANFVHCVFATKQRRNLIPAELRPRLHAYLGGIARKLKINLLVAGGTANHMHVLLAVPSTMPLAEALQKLKANSSRWIRDHGIQFEWQEGYGGFSVSPSLLPVVKTYIENQEEHHRKWSFEDEFRLLLKKSGIAFDDEKLFAA